MRRQTLLFPCLLGMLSVFLLGGCKTMEGWGKKEEEPEEAVEQAEMKVPVGKIHLVSPGGDFVLIRSSKFMSIEPGTILTSHGNGGMETARLQASPARKGAFLTADILSGMPTVGEHTLMDYVAKRTAPGEDPFVSDDDVQVLE